MDLSILPKVTVENLSPALPYLLKIGDKVAEGAARQIGADTWERAKELWTELGPIAIANPFINRAIERVAKNPSKEDAQASLRQELEELLSNNQKLALELSKILETSPSVSSSQVDNRSGGFYGNSIIFQGDAAGRDMTKEIKST